jgi:titin
VIGQTARFECIVQCEPTPLTFWTKNGQTIENDMRHQIEFRNGVCRLTIPQAFQGFINRMLIAIFVNSNLNFIPDDAGVYECVAQNPIGADATRAELIIPGDKRSFRIC